MGKPKFTLEDIYRSEKTLSKKYPRHIKDKIRQQLQFLRDKNYINFLEI
ncbi:MAG: hypothetical protein V2A63_01845 [Patescibacteria group bacterium]